MPENGRSYHQEQCNILGVKNPGLNKAHNLMMTNLNYLILMLAVRRYRKQTPWL
jgi:hypothetical protein